jgi:hypothetical protein
MQAFASADYHPFSAKTDPNASFNQHGAPPGGAQYVSGRSGQPPGVHVAANDTFASPSVQQPIAEVSHQPRKEPPVVPGPGAQRMDLLDYIKQQLDCFGKEPLLMNRYQLLGPEHRATGGVFCCAQ